MELLGCLSSNGTRSYEPASTPASSAPLSPSSPQCLLTAAAGQFTLPLVARAVSTFPGRSILSKSVHSLSIRLGFCCDAYFYYSLIDLYVGCTEISSARCLFDEIPDRDVVSWTTMISGYVHIGDISESSTMFHEMRISGIEPNSVTLAVVLRAVEVGNSADGGKQLHGFAIKGGLWSHDLVQNSILTAYSKVGCFKEAEKLFDGIDERIVVSWNILMLAYSSAGDLFRVLECFQSVMAELYPSPETLTLIISALAKCIDRYKSQQIHSYSVKSGQVDAVLRSSFMNFYAKCADLASSFSLLQEVGMNNSSVPWVAMMWALVQNGRFGQAIGLFRTKQILGFEPTADDLSCLVSACTQLGALLLGKAIHGYLIRHELSAESETKTIETSILNMYSKCGSIILARRCFGTMAYRDTMAWSSMIDGYAVRGIGLKALDMFNQMQDAGIRPNSVTFLSLLSCCSHSGFVSEGCQVFTLMTVKFRIKPEINHYTCMVDLLARAGKLTEALNFVHSMNAKPDGRIWGALLASCRVHQNVKSKGVTMTVLLAKAAAMALIHHPVVNATCKDGKNFTYNSCINIAVAVAIDGGLITPVRQDADKELVSKSRSKQLQPNEDNSGTFTV